MNTTRNFLSLMILLVLTACNLGGGGAANPAVFGEPVLRLTVQTQNNVTTFSQVGEVINYQYVITNTGTTPLAGPVLVTDAPRQPTCPGLNTVGNQDNYLDQNETITCIAAYSVSESDVNTGSITNVATATAGNTTSNQTGITLTRGTAPPSAILTLTKTASSQTYGAANEIITFTFNVTNVGTTPLGPAQFTVSDARLGAPLNCGPADTTLAPNQSVSCSAPYTVTTADMGVANITNSATASGAGQTSAAATVTVVNLLAPATATPPLPATAAPPSNLTPGSTIQHQVAVGEWLIQIGRCYGANFEELRDANPQIANPNFILPAMIVTVPRIGSAGTIYKSATVPCVTFHTVQSGDTWASLAQRYNADQTVLQRVNPGGLVVGQPAKIPLNSAGGSGVVVTAAPPTAVTPGVTTIAPMRITFDGGSTTSSRTGFVNPGQTLQYIVAAQQGQTLTIQLTAPANEVSIGVSGPTGLALKPSDSNYTWTTTILNTGDHTINLASLTGTNSKSYTLQVSLTTATAVPPTATNTPPTPAQ